MKNTEIAFVIMQIGNPDLDKIYKNIIYKVIDECGLVPKRIDKHNEGKFLKGEIISYIENANIIVADLTNERPNCYLEVGYAMGLDKYKNLILTAREDHYFESPNFIKGGPKIHFDLIGYDILFWNPEKLDEFRTELKNRINRRLILIQETKSLLPKKLWNNEWLNEKKNHIETEIKKLNLKGYMEITSTPTKPILELNQKSILEIVKNSEIHTYGWSIGIIFHNDALKPIPKSDGVLSEIVIKDNPKSYDYSYYKKNGQNYIINTFNEDNYSNDQLLIVTRIYRVTEALMYLSRYYLNAKLPEDVEIEIRIRHSGLINRYITSDSVAPPIRKKVSKENEYSTIIKTTIMNIETNLPELVVEVIKPLFILFDFYDIHPDAIKGHVNTFVEDTRKRAYN